MKTFIFAGILIILSILSCKKAQQPDTTPPIIEYIYPAPNFVFPAGNQHFEYRISDDRVVSSIDMIVYRVSPDGTRVTMNHDKWFPREKVVAWNVNSTVPLTGNYIIKTSVTDDAGNAVTKELPFAIQ